MPPQMGRLLFHMNTAKNRATAQKYDVPEGEAARVGELSERLGTAVEFSDGVVESGMYYNGAIRIDPESNTPAHDVLAGDLSRSMQKDPTDYDAFSSALAESPFYKDELARRGLTPEAYRTSIEQAVKKTSGVGLPKEQAQYEAAMRFAKEVLFEDPAAIARFKQADAELFSRVKSWTERMHARLSGSSQENAANALWSMYDKADGGSGSGGGTNIPPTADTVRGDGQTIEIEGVDGENARPVDAKTVAAENDEGYNGEGKTKEANNNDNHENSNSTMRMDLEEFIINPLALQNVKPKTFYQYLKDNGYTVKPLGKGNYAGISFEEGGGYRVNWGGDRILQYHPASRSHHDGAYYKVSSGKTGTIRIYLQNQGE